MNIIETVNISMANANLDIAIEQLEDLLDDVKYPPAIGSYKLGQDICTYTRFVHKNVWRDRVRKEKVLDPIIPVLKRAQRKIRDIQKLAPLNAEEQAKLGKWAVNIRLRTENLEVRYLNGLRSDFPWDEIEPRLKKRSKNNN